MPWQPIEVSAIGLRGFFRHGGKETLLSEILWVWVPTFALLAIVMITRLVNRKLRATPAM